MRRGYNKVSIIKDDTTFYGISLGFDFTAEHEWGIEKMKDKLGISNKTKGLLGFGEKPKFGIENRTISKHSCITFLKENGNAILTTYKPYNHDKKENFSLMDYISYDLKHSTKQELATAWDESDFCVLVSGETNIKLLEELYEHFQNNNIAIATLKGGPFENSSLSLLIVDRLPKESLQEMYDVDKNHYDLVEYEKEIGMTKLKEENKGGYGKENYFMACSAKWINYENAEAREESKANWKTKFDIIYWINYSDDDNNYGYYTVEEIRQWLSTAGLKLTQIRKANQ